MITIIGEASRQISKPYKESHPDIPWSLIIGMRNKLMHQYFGVDYEALWETLTTDIPELKNQITLLLNTD